MSVPADHIVVTHGSLTVYVPRNIFKGQDAIPDADAAGRFRTMLSQRYPWLSANALDVLMANARDVMLGTLDDESGGRASARRLSDRGDVEGAVRILKERLDQFPDDADSWYMLGELLCRQGRTEEGYKAMAKGRRSFE